MEGEGRAAAQKDGASHTRNAIRLMIGALLVTALVTALAVAVPTVGEGAEQRVDLPSVALGQESLYRVEIFLLVFYGGLLIGTPAFRGIVGGRLPTKISARGAEFAEETAQTIAEAQKLVEELRGDLQTERANAVRARLNIDQIAREANVKLED